jgi:Cys-tRNA(Pro)/Cys-tRNA(Cys) deacylase
VSPERADLEAQSEPESAWPDLAACRYLDEKNIPYKRMTFPVQTEKGAANVARALGYPERAMVKTLIFETDKGEKALIMVGGDQNAISGHLKKVLGSRNIKMASPETVIEVTGYPIGSIPPFHWQAVGFRTIIDQALMQEEALGVGTGQWGQEIIISPADLARACAGTIVNLTMRDCPIFPEELK